MPNDPRLAALANLLQTRYSHSPERAREWAEDILPLIDAVDPLRQAPSDAAVNAAMTGFYYPHPEGTLDLPTKIRSAIVAALAVMRGEVTTKFVNCTIADAPDGVRLTEEPQPFQVRVNDWIQHCFGHKIGVDKTERNHRFLEEALELVQSGGCTKSEAHQLVDYVFGRPVGEMKQEVGGVMNTLAAFCNAYEIELNAAADAELARCWEKTDLIRAKQAAKPKHSPLPEAPGHTDLMVSPEAIDAFVDANPPPDAIEDRIAALEARPQWTEEKERVVKFALNTLRRSMLNGNVATFGKWLAESDSVIKSAFPQPERVWPPADCLEKETCTRSGYCEADGTNCSHAGERA